MAVSAKTPAIPLLTELLLPLPSKPKTPKSRSFSPTHQTLQISIKKPAHEISASVNTNPIPNTTNLNPEISLLCSRGNLQQALQLLEDSSNQECSIPIEEETYISLLRLCECKRASPEGARVYAHLCSSSSSLTHFSVRLGNALLSMFVRFGNLLDAWFVFGKMAERDVFSWNVMVGGYAKAGFLDEALNLYHRMLWVGIRPDLYTFPCVLRSCGGIPDLVRGREIHAHVIRFGYESEIDVVNAMVTMYAKCGDFFSARRLFDGMPKRDRISWNAMISGYFENGECLEGLWLFLRMRVLSIEPDLMTMTSVVSACELLGDLILAREIHGYVIRTGVGADVSVCNALIQMYVSVRKLEEAEKVFIGMGYKDVVSWTAMISGYDKNGLPSKAVQTYEQMKLEGVMPDEITIASVLSACSCLGLLDRGIELHEFANRRGLIAYTIVGNMLIDMYSKCRFIDKALEVFKRMPEKNVISWSSMILGFRINNKSFEALNFFRKMQIDVKPNTVTFIAALAACAGIGALMCGKEIHAHVLRNGLGFEGFLPNALLDMYVKCGRMEHARIQFNVHESKDVASWNIMLTGYAKRGHGALAIELFDRMIEVGVSPDEITFISLLCACSRSGMVSEGRKYFISMSQHYSVMPNLKHYTCMVDLLGRAGHLEEAHEFIEKMPMVPDAGVWGALLNACRIHQRVDLGELAARFIFELDSESVGYYALLCNLYANDGRWDAVARVRRLMIERGLSVDPGCSWVEAKGAVHAFLSGDESHPQMNDIRAVLNGLYERMKTAGFDMPENNCMDEVEASKEEIFCGHSERLAVAFGLINTTPGMPIWVTKNLYMCSSCHNTIKLISKVVRREIAVRDSEQFHHFKDGTCSCGDEGYWGRRNK
ncbi:pentatricopeptide repeat-containing protein At1g15510, chloroplastic-like [Magnolia sinica]|uniref:pentatricopeptide repeat-containing protein At1g15510, chloroplastic-like n=1 Tax=Magnolia sinica TaxID=86752 RepID=UPI00265AC24B|nr:pentatricopeptide repeat-containing protein At1g15510, chloroplastic-like [Magnolia sinica]